MSEPDRDPNDEIVDQIHEIQEEIFDREDEIDDLIDGAGRPKELVALSDWGQERRKARHRERLLADWNAIVARSRELSDNEFELLSAMVRFVGDLLMAQPEGAEVHWIEQLESYLEESRVPPN